MQYNFQQRKYIVKSIVKNIPNQYSKYKAINTLMNIVVASHTFYPDHSGIAVYASDFAFYASENGHNVDVVTGFPFYPQWKKRGEDTRRLFKTEKIKGITIHRGYLYVSAKSGLLHRLLNELTFVIFAMLNIFKIKKKDVIVVFTTPISLGWICAILKRVHGAKIVINVQDFQLEAGQALNITSNSIFFDLLKKVEKYSYDKADLVTSISNSMTGILLSKKEVHKDKVQLWPNWIDKMDYLDDISVRGKFRQKYLLSDNVFLVGYAGNIGEKQGLEFIVEVAKKMEHYQNIKFVIAGDGKGRYLIENKIKELSPSNVILISFLSPSEYKEFLQDINVFVLTQKKTDGDLYFPSKLLGIMAYKRLLLVCADDMSELYSTIQQHNCGLVSSYGDEDILVAKIVQLFEGKINSENILANALEYANQFERSYILDKIIGSIKSIK